MNGAPAERNVKFKIVFFPLFLLVMVCFLQGFLRFLVLRILEPYLFWYQPLSDLLFGGWNHLAQYSK